MKNTPGNEQIFWNARAGSYPRPFDRSTYAKTSRILRLLKMMGTDFKGRDILDIGCGTGVYALALAAKAGRVLGIDSSAAMLKAFREQRRTRKLLNARCRKIAWHEVPSAEVRGRFDIALASMTMAIKTRSDLRKMEEAVKEQCVYIGWAGVRKNSLLEKVYKHHGLTYKAPEGASRILKILKSLGRQPRVKYITDSWTKNIAPALTLRELAINMRVNDICLDLRWTRKFLERRIKRGKIRQITRVRKALITWTPKNSAHYAKTVHKGKARKKQPPALKRTRAVFC